MTTSPEVAQVYLNELKDLYDKISWLLTYGEHWSEDGTFCFPDGDVWHKPHHPEPTNEVKRATCTLSYSTKHDYLYFDIDGERVIGVPLSGSAVPGAAREGVQRIAKFLRDER